MLEITSDGQSDEGCRGERLAGPQHLQGLVGVSAALSGHVKYWGHLLKISTTVLLNKVLVLYDIQVCHKHVSIR